MSETKHPWCISPSRDEAIRAAEDAAAAERTPLPDHRDLPAAVADLRRRVEGLETVADHWRRQCEAEADAEKREAAPASRAGVNADGLRAERVTLEITHGNNFPPSEWVWVNIMPLSPGESVRVVEDRTGTDMGNGVTVASTEEVLAMCRETEARLTAERDAAIRERDAARGECDRLRAEKAADWKAACESALAASIEVGNLKARVAELERKCDELRSERERLIEERDAANAGGVSNPEPISGAGKSNHPGKLESSQEPVAWGVLVGGKIDRHAGSDALFIAKDEADDWCGAASLRGRGTVVPLYAAPVAESATTPQPPRGWLTSEERACIEELLPYTFSGVQAKRLTDLLARSTPPRGCIHLSKEDCESLYLARAVLDGVFVGSWQEKHDAARRLVGIRERAIREAGGEVCE